MTSIPAADAPTAIPMMAPCERPDDLLSTLVPLLEIDCVEDGVPVVGVGAEVTAAVEVMLELADDLEAELVDELEVELADVDAKGSSPSAIFIKAFSLTVIGVLEKEQASSMD